MPRTCCTSSCCCWWCWSPSVCANRELNYGNIKIFANFCNFAILLFTLQRFYNVNINKFKERLAEKVINCHLSSKKIKRKGDNCYLNSKKKPKRLYIFPRFLPQSIKYPNEDWNWRLLRHVFYQPYFMLYGEVYAPDIDPGRPFLKTNKPQQ